MEVLHREDESEFRIEENGEVVAELGYFREAGVITIEHTRVDEKLRSRGVGRQLVEAAVSFAREKGERIKPLCSFARAVFDQNAKYEDVRAAD